MGARFGDTLGHRRRASRAGRARRRGHRFTAASARDDKVGKLLGFETREVAGVTRDYLFIAFRGDDRLYVPHEQIGRLSRYVGADTSAPALSKLGGKAWEAMKARARRAQRQAA